MKSHSLVLDRLVVAREGAQLTAPISLQLKGGEMLAIRGNNGSGKSTLLKTVAGLLRPLEGEAYLCEAEGREPSEPSVRLIDSPLYFGHKRALTPSLSVYDNVSFWAKASGHPELIMAAMRYWDLQDIPDVIVETLSAGWQQRVALTRLITLPSPLWLLDEPTSNLDSEGIGLLQSLMQSRLEQGGIILVATHFDLQGDRIKTLNLSMIERTSDLEASC